MCNLAQVITSAVIAHGIAQEEDRELYEYSFLVLLEQASVWVSILCISCLAGIFFETLLYMALFIPMRVYAGGYHARTFTWCYFVSVGVYLVFAMLQYFVRFSSVVLLLTAVLSAVVIWALSPMADPNKPMSEKEALVYTKKVRVILIGELLLSAVMFAFNYISILPFFSFAFLHLALLLVAGKIAFKKLLHCEQEVEAG